MSGKAISEELKMPLAFTVKILQEMAKKNVISSSKGPRGGFYLSRENCRATLMDLLKVFGDDNYFNSCALGLQSCSDDYPCPVHKGITKCRKEMKSVFEHKTIDEISKGLEDNSFVLVV